MVKQEDIELYNTVPLSELQEDHYIFVQNDSEVESILQDYNINGDNEISYNYLVVKLAKNGAEYAEIWAGDSPNLDASYELISHLIE